MSDTYTLYSMQSSGNCYKPRLLMHHLGLPFTLVETDPRTGATKTPGFLELNPNGRVPLLILPDGRRLSESNAMLLYLAEGTRFLPADRYERALVNQWLFFEQYEHEPVIAVARSWISVYPDRMARVTDEMKQEWQVKGARVLGVMEKQSGGARLDGGQRLLGRRYGALRLYARRRRRRLRSFASIPASRAG